VGQSIKKRQTVIIVTGATSHREYLSREQMNPSKGNLVSMKGNMIDTLFNVAVFATLVLCIVGFSGWAHKRVDAQ